MWWEGSSSLKEASNAPVGSLYSLLHGINSYSPFHPAQLLPFTHLCNLDGKHTSGHFIQLWFARLHSPCCSLSCGLFFLISFFKDWRRFQKEGSKENGNVSSLAWSLRSFPLCCWISRASQNSSNIPLPSRPGRSFWLSVEVCLSCASLVHILGWVFGSRWLFQVLWYASWKNGWGESPFAPKVLKIMFSLFIPTYC